MKVPLLCYTCDKAGGDTQVGITQHTLQFPCNAKCTVCGSVRAFPILRWLLLIIIGIILIFAPWYLLYLFLMGKL
jgi:hypothetical protein